MWLQLVANREKKMPIVLDQIVRNIRRSENERENAHIQTSKQQKKVSLNILSCICVRYESKQCDISLYYIIQDGK